MFDEVVDLVDQLLDEGMVFANSAVDFEETARRMFMNKSGKQEETMRSVIAFGAQGLVPSVNTEAHVPDYTQQQKRMINMPRIFATVVTATILLAIAPAQAQENGSFYAGGDLGLVFSGNTRTDGVFTGTGSPFDGQRLGPEPGQTAKGIWDSGLTTGVTVGYDMGSRRFGRFRFEGEYFHQKADTENYNGELDGSVLNPAGRVDTTMTGVVANVLYSFGEFAAVRPYAYFGYGRAKIDTKYDFPNRGQVAIDGGGSAVLQGGFGADIPLNERTTVDLKYRFRRSGFNEWGLDTDIDTHILQAGIRFAF
ncbi:MAG: outer membrane beta-barrel protein [Rhodospirillaceae bacterium]|nr:outer membrane beta-barrel protein [Rhodospirillaceae bacterium]